MIACTLAFDLDGENAQDFVPLTRMYTLTRKPEKKYISLDTRHVPRASADEGVNSVMQDFIVFLSAEPHRLLESGLSYLRCVVEQVVLCASLLIPLLAKFFTVCCVLTSTCCAM